VTTPLSDWGWISRDEFLKPIQEISQHPIEQHFFISQEWFRTYCRYWTEDETFATYGVVNAGSNVAHLKNAAGFLLSSSQRRSRLGISFRSLGLNEGSSEGLRYVTPEMNGVLTSCGFKNEEKQTTEALKALLDALQKRQNEWDEMRVSAMPKSIARHVEDYAKDSGLLTHSIATKSTYWIDLKKVRSAFEGDYLASRSANTRGQLRRALKKAEAAFGPVVAAVAATEYEMMEWFSELKRLHRLRWGGSGDGSGFDHKAFEAFHDQVSKDYLVIDRLNLMRVSAGNKVLGYLHFYIEGKVVYFNMSGVDYDIPPSLKPGLLCHWSAIEMYLKLGLERYDFMVGTNRYKQSLATDVAELSFFVIRQARWHFRLENLLRSIKRRFARNVTDVASAHD
jgi:Acetyltransferase (GNAT) domain